MKDEERFLWELKDLLSLASFQLEDYISLAEDIEYARNNIETALSLVVDRRKGQGAYSQRARRKEESRAEAELLFATLEALVREAAPLEEIHAAARAVIRELRTFRPDVGWTRTWLRQILLGPDAAIWCASRHAGAVDRLISHLSCCALSRQLREVAAELRGRILEVARRGDSSGLRDASRLLSPLFEITGAADEETEDLLLKLLEIAERSPDPGLFEHAVVQIAQFPARHAPFVLRRLRERLRSHPRAQAVLRDHSPEETR